MPATPRRSRRRYARRLNGILVAAALALTTTACSAGSTTDGEPDATTTLRISAAASLGAAFDEMAAAFSQEHPEIDVAPIVYDGSSTLATQIVEGADVDVFASANEANMTTVVDAGLAAEAVLFATNTLVVAVPAGNPADIESLADLADPDAIVVLCAVEVPCGDASQTLLDAAGLSVAADSYEQNVTAVLTKVAAGEADAGLVYATDVAGEDAADSFVPEGADEVVNRYPIAALTDSDAAVAFVEFVTGARGQGILASYGFGAP